MSAVRNVGIVARREYGERVHSRAFAFSTVLLAGLAIVVALIPLAVRLLDRVTITRVAVASTEAGLAATAAGTMDSFLNSQGASGAEGGKTFDFLVMDSPEVATAAVSDGGVAGAVVVDRTDAGGLGFRVITVGALGSDRQQLLQVGAFAVGILDWTASQPAATRPFVIPGFSVEDASAAASPGQGSGPSDAAGAADYASRRIVGIVFVVISFLTLVFYGMWVAAGVVAEKANRVMELLISAATVPQLVIGKIAGIGLAGLTQVGLVLAPALAVMLLSGSIGDALGGAGAGTGSSVSLAALSPGLLLAFVVYFVLGFTLYAALYAGAGSLLSRAEDLQVIALPLSLPAIAGYMPAVLALSGSTSIVIRVASYVPFWSPFAMLARLSVGRVEPWELALSLGLMLITVPLVTALSIRVYRGGVLMYGQAPSLRSFIRVLRG